MKILSALVLMALASGLVRAQFATANPDFKSATIIQTVQPIFPNALSQVYSHGGSAQIVIRVSSEGKLTDWLALGYTDHRFVDLALEAAKKWRFEPARLRGEPVPVQITLTFDFKVKGIVVSLSTSIDNFREYMETIVSTPAAHRLYTLRELDHIPIPIQVDPPVYPKAQHDAGIVGNVIVDFYIDETGAVRMPSTGAGSPNNLARYAVDAIQKWRFEPPTHHGQAVMVEARQIFKFGTKDASKVSGP